MSLASQLVFTLNHLRMEHHLPALHIVHLLSLNAETRRLAESHAGAFHVSPLHVSFMGEMLGWIRGATNPVAWLAHAFFMSPEHHAIFMSPVWNGIGASCQTVQQTLHCAIEFGIMR